MTAWSSPTPDARARDAEARALAQREFDRPLVLEAGAGTGKTTTLVARVLSWVLGPGWEKAEALLTRRSRRKGEKPEPDRIAARVLGGVVAITFTELAASEMASRVGEGLALIEGGKVPGGLDPEVLPQATELRSLRARALLGALDQLVVRTIHSFCRRLLATFPLEAGLHPHFQVDADGELLRALARELVETRLKEVYGAPGDPDYLALAAQGFGPQEIADALETLGREAIPAAALDEDPVSPAAVRTLVARLQTHAELLRDQIAGRLEAGRKDRLKLAFAVLSGLDALLEHLDGPGVPDIAELQVRAAECFPENVAKHLGEWGKGRLSQTEDALLGAALPEIRAQAAALSRLLRHIGRLQPELLVLARDVLHPLLHELERQLRFRGIQTFTGLLRDARDLLASRPDVAARVRAEIDQLLVDEFQDTDRIQCDVVRNLALEGPAPRPGLFLVGDPKQSIYGWRSADLRAYDDFADLVEQMGGRRCSLVVNYRSAPVILSEVARVFRRAMRPAPGLQPAFQELIASPKTESNPGFTAGPWAPVEYWVSWSVDPSGAGPAKKTRSVDAIEREAEGLARDLLALHREHGIAWRDAAILLRSTGDLDVVLNALRQANIPYAVERDKSYYRRREIIDASAFVRCILDPNDHLALLTVLRSPAVGVPDAALIPLWVQGLPGLVSDLTGPDADRLATVAEAVRNASAELPADIPGIDAVRGWEQSLLAAVAGVAELRESLEHSPADLWVERLRARFLIEATEAARYHGHYRLANLERFFRTLVAALERDGGDPQALLRSLRASVAGAREAEEGRPKETAGNAVQVMTIHKAKGLDFRHVYLLQTHKESPARDRAVTTAALADPDPMGPGGGGERWEMKLFGAPSLGYDLIEARNQSVGQAERVRTLYVAMTRAKDRLVIAGDLPPAPVPLDLASTHADLLSNRDLPALTEAMTALCKDGGRDRLVAEDASWVFVSLQARDLRPMASEVSAVEQPGIEVVTEHQRRLARARAEAEERERRPLGVVASSETHELLRASVAERRFADERGGDEGLGAVGSEPLAIKERVLLAVGSAVHRVLETFDLSIPVAAELARQRRRLAGYLRALVGPEDLRSAESRAQKLMDRLAEGPLLERLRALAPHILARELPLLLPAEAAFATEEASPVGYVTGSIDLLYRDPDSGDLVVVDYKADAVDGAVASLEALARAFAPQARVYVEAVASSLGARPRLELWFLHTGDVLRVEA